jgi:hypothetical protein
MKLTSLELSEIGPFDTAAMSFQTESPAVTLVTGENGTGKSVVLDALRLAFGRPFVEPSLLRDIRRAPTVSVIRMESTVGEYTLRRAIRPRRVRGAALNGQPVAADFWSGSLFTGGFQISNFKPPGDPKHYQHGALESDGKNTDTTNLLCYFDYLRDSRDPEERATGELAWSLAERIVAKVVPGGRLLPVKRATFEPRIEQHGRSMPLELLSTGSLYTLSHLVRLLMRMHQCNLVHPSDEPLHTIPGILLIDEPETHLHPKWQKHFLPDVIEVFPNLQIIAATHSPFVVSSVRGARVYRCRAVEGGAVVEQVERDFGSQTVDETLASPAFSETNPYPEAIARLVAAREAAKQAGDTVREQAIEKELLALNPDAFGAFRFREVLQGLGEAS